VYNSLVSAASPSTPVSPWRRIFEQVRQGVGNQRDAVGALGSINWLRHHMHERGANPNVVRNIIYRDKGRSPDKRVLFSILDELWQAQGRGPLEAPELEVLLAPVPEEDQTTLSMLGRDKRRAYKSFVTEVATGAHPKMLIVGPAGSGKTLLADLIEQAIVSANAQQRRVLRVSFNGDHIATPLTRMANAVGVSEKHFAARLLKADQASSFAVQADAQAEVARTILDAVRVAEEEHVLLLHIDHSFASIENFGRAPLRLNDAEVTRVNAGEWLWISLIEPLARLPHTAIWVGLNHLPLRAHARLGAFSEPIRLTPPSTAEARRFVRSMLPNRSEEQHEEIVRSAGRSFEELRTRSLLTEIRAPSSDASSNNERALHQLAHNLEVGDPTLRHFLAAIATLSLPDDSSFGQVELDALLDNIDPTPEWLDPFMDPVPGPEAGFRVFSRELAEELRERLRCSDPQLYRELHQQAAQTLAEEAWRDPRSRAGQRYVAFTLEAGDWGALIDYLTRHGCQQASIHRIWARAEQELKGTPLFERIAHQVAHHYVTLGSYSHPDVLGAFAVLAEATAPELRIWTTLRRAEGMTLSGRTEEAAALLSGLPQISDPLLAADAAIAEAGVARWRGEQQRAEELIRSIVDNVVGAGDVRGASEGAGIASRARLWAGLLAKDAGDLAGALEHFDSVAQGDDLMAARAAFQRGDIFMRLGHYDRALLALREANEAAKRSDALAIEQTRYLTRLATIHRRRSDHASATALFEQARTLLAEAAGAAARPEVIELWRARLEDEAGLLLLALGRYDEAAAVFHENLGWFRAYAERHAVDATYRGLRCTLRLSIAYGCRAVQQRFMRPFLISEALSGHHPDLQQARTLLREIVDTIDRGTNGAAFNSLAMDALLIVTLFGAPADAVAMGERAVSSARFPYQRAQAHAHAAAARIRVGEFDRALEHIEKGRSALAASVRGGGPEPKERGDLELAAWFIELDSTAKLQAGDATSAGHQLAAGLRNPNLAPYHRMLLRSFGEQATAAAASDWLASDELGDALGMKGGDALVLGALRLPDALVERWRRVSGEI